MFKKLSFFLLLFCTFLIGFAQQKNHDEKVGGKEKIKALYIAYITRELNLNELEAQKFWPVHALYDAEIKGVNKQNLTELEKEEAALLIKKRYKDKFVPIIGKDRSDIFFKKDKEFRNKLIDKIRKNKDEIHNKKE
jgi:hypothetical protein